jgi:hypothetical protein
MQAPTLVANRRVRQMDGLYFVAVRNPGEWHEVREFVQPSNPQVVKELLNCRHDYWSCLDWVCRNIQYRIDVGEFWQFPAETLLRGYGDCDDSSILLTSMLRSFQNAYCVLGTYCGFGHAWVTPGTNEILETTYTYARVVLDPGNYKPYILFNDEEVIEIWPGALLDIYSAKRNDCRKLLLMSGEKHLTTNEI